MSILLRLDTIEQLAHILSEKLIRDSKESLNIELVEKLKSLQSSYSLSDNKSSLDSLTAFEQYSLSFQSNLSKIVINKDISEYSKKLISEIDRLKVIHKNAIKLQD